MTRPPSPQTTRFYRTVSITFGLLAVAVLIAVAVLAAGRATVTVTLEPNPIQAKFTVQIAPTPDAEGVLAGRYLTTTQTGNREVPARTDSTTPAKAHGTVQIRNTSSANQPLAAGTRLLSEGGVLFRTTARLDVPAGGSRDAEVEADQAGAEGEIGPSHFTLPGLRAENQTRIFGESTTPMVGGTVATTSVSDEDRAAAREALRTDLVAQAQADLEQQAAEAGPWTMAVLATHETPLLGDDDTVALRLELEAIAFAPDELNARAQAELVAAAPAGWRVAITGDGASALALSAADGDRATIAVTTNGTATLDQANPILSAAQFTNKKPSDLTAWAARTEGVAEATATLSPPWASHTPSSTTRIRVVIRE